MIHFNPISLAFWAKPKGAVLIIIKASGNHLWNVILQGSYRPTPPTIVPGYEVRLANPCNKIEMEMQYVGEKGSNFEIQGTAGLA